MENIFSVFASELINFDTSKIDCFSACRLALRSALNYEDTLFEQPHPSDSRLACRISNGHLTKKAYTAVPSHLYPTPFQLNVDAMVTASYVPLQILATQMFFSYDISFHKHRN